MLELILAAVVLTPIIWLACEFQNRVWLRIVTGIAAMAAVFMVSQLYLAVKGFDSNSYFGTANQKFIRSTISGLKNGNSESVLKELQSFSNNYEPTYETRANYEELVEAYSKNLKDQRSNELD